MNFRSELIFSIFLGAAAIALCLWAVWWDISKGNIASAKRRTLQRRYCYRCGVVFESEWREFPERCSVCKRTDWWLATAEMAMSLSDAISGTQRIPDPEPPKKDRLILL